MVNDNLHRITGRTLILLSIFLLPSPSSSTISRPFTRSTTLDDDSTTVTWSIGEEIIQNYIDPHPYQFPDSAFSVLNDDNNLNVSLMFWTDGTTYRTNGTLLPSSSVPFLPNVSSPSPLNTVLATGPPNSYDANGNWLLYVHRLPNRSLIGFTHAENHNFSCPGPYAEWNCGAIVGSDNDGYNWTRLGVAIHDSQPCVPQFGGTGYSSIIPRSLLNPSYTGFLGFGGCTAYQTTDENASSGSWFRYLNGNFSSPGINGTSSCLPGVPSNSCCPIVHYNSYLQKFIMLITLWGVDDKVYISFSDDALNWNPMTEFFNVSTDRTIGYPQILGTNSTVAGQFSTLVYAGAPPQSKYPRDFITRSVNFTLTRKHS